MPETIRLDIAPPRATLTLAKPEKHNALEADDMRLLARLLDTVEAREDVRVAVLMGTGKSFCAGADIGTLPTGNWGDSPLDRLTDRIERLRQPIIAALNGGVFGGGADIALACDFRIGVEGMRMFVPPARLGIHYPLAGLERLVARVGVSVAKRVMMANETFDGPALLAAGWIDRLVPAASLNEAVDELVGRLAGLAPLSVQGMKRTLNAIARGAADPADVRAAARVCAVSEDHREGLAAFAEKRAPVFTGR